MKPDESRGNHKKVLLKRMNSALHAFRCQAKNTADGEWRRVYNGLRVDSRTTSSGATLRWNAGASRFSSTALMPSTTMPTAVAPIGSMGWRIVVKGGV